MISPARIEAATSLGLEYGWNCTEEEMARVLEAAFPELVPEISDGLPHAWIAPWGATQAMRSAAASSFVEEELMSLRFSEAYRKMRDAHLSREQSE